HQKRYEAGGWKKDFRSAVDAANHSNSVAFSLLQSSQRDRLVILDYDRFWYREKNLRNLFRHLRLDANGIKDHVIRKCVQIARTGLEKRKLPLTDEQRRYIQEHYDAEKERNLKAASPAK